MKTPGTASELLSIVVTVLRVEPLLGPASKKALQRWINSGRSPRSARVRARLANEIVGEALPRSRFPTIFGLPSEVALPALATGALRSLKLFDENRADWLLTMTATVASVLARCEVRPLRHQGGGVATAPDWLFAGRRGSVRLTADGGIAEPEKEVRPVSQRVADRLAPQVRADKRGRLRKNVEGLAAGDLPHHDTLLQVAYVAATPTFPFSWALEQAVIELSIDPITMTFFLSTLSSWADRLASVGAAFDVKDDMFFADVLGGSLFTAEVAAALRGQPPATDPTSPKTATVSVET